METDMTFRTVDDFRNDVIVLDGLWGSGKSLLSPLISGMDRVEKIKVNYNYEYICQLNHLGKIETDAAVVLLQISAAVDQYNNLIGRDTNIRWTDDSGIANHPHAFRYLRRAFGPEGDAVVEQINGNNLAVSLLTHMILPVATPLREAFRDRLKIIEVVRHPVYVFSHWKEYLSRFLGPREFTISYELNGEKVPWFAQDYAGEYARLSAANRAATCIMKMYQWLFHVIDNTVADNNALLILSFEEIVLNTHRTMDRLGEFLGRSHSRRLGKLLAKQKIPRSNLTAGRGLSAYGFESNPEMSDQELFLSTYGAIQNGLSSDTMASFNRCIKEYDMRFPSILCQVGTS